MFSDIYKFCELMGCYMSTQSIDYFVCYLYLKDKFVPLWFMVSEQANADNVETADSSINGAHGN